MICTCKSCIFVLFLSFIFLLLTDLLCRKNIGSNRISNAFFNRSLVQLFYVYVHMNIFVVNKYKLTIQWIKDIFQNNTVFCGQITFSAKFCNCVKNPSYAHIITLQHTGKFKSQKTWKKHFKWRFFPPFWWKNTPNSNVRCVCRWKRSTGISSNNWRHRGQIFLFFFFFQKHLRGMG